MDIERFRHNANHPDRTKEELVTMRRNALRMGAVDHVRVAEEVLDKRFPGWNAVRSRRGGATPTDVSFLGQRRHFPTAKEAYVWLIERFVQHYPKPFVEIDWETVFIAQGQRTLFFAKSLTKLFAGAPHLAADPNHYHRLIHGWFAKLVLSNKQKLEILLKFASIAKLEFGKDWDWNALGQKHLDVDELLKQLDEL